MSLLSYNELVELVEQNVITNVKPECINAASIDIHLGPEILTEACDYGAVIDLSVKPRQSVRRTKMDITGHYYDLSPGEGILAHTVEIFNLPDDIVGEYYLNSSLARNHLEHLHAGHMDAGFHGSTLTLEFVNLNRYHALRIRPGMRAGQVLFYRVAPVPAARSYAAVGNYNNSASVVSQRG
jgi:deoxycytidine triphosphate deaminase